MGWAGWVHGTFILRRMCRAGAARLAPFNLTTPDGATEVQGAAKGRDIDLYEQSVIAATSFLLYVAICRRHVAAVRECVRTWV